MYTSNFARLKRLPPELEPVSIAVGSPKWFTGRRELRLAPTRPMLSMDPGRYDQFFEDILRALDPRNLWLDLGDNVALLCWEPPKVRCHRRRVAEWFERELGLIVPEFGFERAEIERYAEMPPKRSRKTSLLDN